MDVATDQEIADDLSRPADLLSAPMPALVCEGQIEQLQAPLERGAHPHLVASLGSDGGPSHLAADIRQLLDEGELGPAPGRKAGMARRAKGRLGAHAPTSRSTAASIA